MYTEVNEEIWSGTSSISMKQKQWFNVLLVWVIAFERSALELIFEKMLS